MDMDIRISSCVREITGVESPYGVPSCLLVNSEDWRNTNHTNYKNSTAYTLEAIIKEV